MVEYPIRIPREMYRGNNPKKRERVNRRNSTAAEMERKINAVIAKQETPFHSYIYAQLAHELGYTTQEVSDLCMGIDGGHNGFTVIKPGLTYAQAMAIVDEAAPEHSRSTKAP